MDQRDRLPQIELAAGDAVTALVLRHLEPLTAADLDRLRAFACEHGVQWWLQPKGPETVHLLDDDVGPDAGLWLPEFGVVMPFQADRLHAGQSAHQPGAGRRGHLKPAGVRRRTERVIDWFCGLGNFTLPLATRARQVHRHRRQRRAGAACARQRRAQRPGRRARAFEARDLFEIARRRPASCRRRVPTLAGGPAARRRLCAGQGPGGPARQRRWKAGSRHRRIVYVSCNPGHAGARRRSAGPPGRLTAVRLAGVVNMFPHTAHVESHRGLRRET
jgi:23S rRNA (uracil1939-C5)-methyltransferase